MTPPDDPPREPEPAPFTWTPPTPVPPQPHGEQPTWEQPTWEQPSWGHPGWGPAPHSQAWVPFAPARTTNGWAVAALVTGILPLPPVAVGCGITALVQTRRRDQAGKGLAIAGLVLGGVWTLIITVFVIAALTGALDYESKGRISDLPSTALGTCLKDPGGPTAWRVHDCTSVHDAEVYHVSAFEDTPWPGADSLALGADDICLSAFKGYVGESYYLSDHEYGYFTPDEAEWIAGERRVVCVVVAGFADRLVGSVRGGS